MPAFSRCLVLLAGLVLAFPLRSEPPNQIEVTGLVFTHDGKTLISAGLDGTLRWWDVRQGTERFQVPAHTDGVYGLALSSDGKLLASAGGDQRVRLWDAATGKALRTLTGHDKEVAAVAFAPHGQTLASASYDKTVRLWQVETGTEIAKLEGHEERVTSVAFSPDGQLLASAGVVSRVERRFRRLQQSDLVRLWKVATRQEIAQLPQRGRQVAFTADGRRLISVGGWWNGTSNGFRARYSFASGINVWDMVRGTEWCLLGEYQYTLALSPDGHFLATGWGSPLHGEDIVYPQDTSRAIQLRELATTKEVLQFGIDLRAAAVLALSPDSATLAVARQDGTVEFRSLAPAGWHADTARNSLDATGWEKRWTALAGEDAVAAYEALWTLAAAEDTTIAWLTDHLQPVPALRARTAEQIRQLITRLDDDRFEVREAATRELARLGLDAEPELVWAWHHKPVPEVRQRLEGLLAGMAQVLPPERLRQRRCVQVLERIGTRNAANLLRAVAAGAAHTWLTGEAQAALDRLTKRGINPP